ncbi:DUF262 domain-containing protein [Daejeonella sp. H1SJ63]|uniref:DUF262 domain-containing protein n=1 Tax=Daejeonella sp. H1SJ63 TaxID=3034145 RepID=UPI0023ED49D7|nr:DUF262 domain-containing protein [Daejeonella sp. H1SJ63]
MLKKKVVRLVLFKLMKISPKQITIKEVISLKNQIDPKPQYQRTSVWLPPKKKLLIDSILRGYDLPKFYVSQGQMFKYEVIDGQQRMRAIWEFANLEYKLDDSIIEGVNIKGYSFTEIVKNPILKDKLLNFPISLAVVTDYSQEEIRTLFARLQMGEKLNSVELRHAIASNIGFAIIALANVHEFFNEKECKIKNGRYKHQDYLDNALTACHYDCMRNIKGVDMKNLYLEFANATIVSFQDLLQKADQILTLMKEINLFFKGVFKNKWAFVDIFYLLYKNIGAFKGLKAQEFANTLRDFETKRVKYNKTPEVLIEDKSSDIYDKDLYDYIIAFKTGGSLKENLKVRNRVFQSKFFNDSNFTLQ